MEVSRRVVLLGSLPATMKLVGTENPAEACQTPSGTESPAGTLVTTVGPMITGSLTPGVAGTQNTFALNSAGQVVVNGNPLPPKGFTQLYIINHSVFCYTPGSPAGATPGAGSFKDTAGNTWALNSAGQPTINGVVPQNTFGATLLYLIGNTIWNVSQIGGQFPNSIGGQPFFFTQTGTNVGNWTKGPVQAAMLGGWSGPITTAGIGTLLPAVNPIDINTTISGSPQASIALNGISLLPSAGSGTTIGNVSVNTGLANSTVGPGAYTWTLLLGGADGSHFNLVGTALQNATQLPAQKYHITITASNGSGLSISTPFTIVCGTVPVPLIAAAAGYTSMTFGPAIIAGMTKDPNNSNLPKINTPPGANMYGFTFFGDGGNFDNNVTLVHNSDGSLTISNGPGPGAANAGYGAGMCSAVIGLGPWTPTNFGGIAFGGGGYFEATMSFSGTSASNITGLGAFWSNDIESMNGGFYAGNAWPAQSSPNPGNYGDWIEVDFAEFDVPVRYGFSPANWYGVPAIPSTVFAGPFDWGGPQGTYDGTKWVAPAGVDYTKPNRFGCLWVPATATTPGHIEMYFNGILVSNRMQWNPYNPALRPPPTNGPVIGGNGIAGGATIPSSAISVLDNRHLALILGGATGITIYGMQVWQPTGANNYVNGATVIVA